MIKFLDASEIRILVSYTKNLWFIVQISNHIMLHKCFVISSFMHMKCVFVWYSIPNNDNFDHY